MSNIEESSYSESWLPFDDRANVIDVKFWDKANNYEADVVTIMTDQYEDDLNNFTEERKTSIDYVGCTDRAMASYFGKFLLNCNKYITLTATWTAFVDAIGCYPGQIIEVQNDLPQYGYGGRILEVYSGGGIRIDQTFNFELNETYELVIYSQSDARSYYTFTVIDNELDDILTTDILKPDSFNFYDSYGTPASLSLDSGSYLDAKYNFGRLQSSCKLMRVLSISHASDDKRKITAVEFLNDVYDGSLTINPFDPGDLPNQFRPPKLKDTTTTADWVFNSDKKMFDPYIQIKLNQDPNTDYYNTFKIDYYRIYAHLVKGDVHEVKYSGVFEVEFDWSTLTFIYLAYGFDKYTIYTKAKTHNVLKYWSYFSAITAAYIDLSVAANFVADLMVYEDMEGTDFGYIYETDRFMIAIKWQPAGCELKERDAKPSVYLPILDWNYGDNYYTYSNYVIAYGITDNANQYPNYKNLTIIETANIGDIYDVSGVLIDPKKEENYELLDQILRKSSVYGLYFKYQFKHIHIAVIAKTKYGGISKIDLAREDLGLNWIHVYMPLPYTYLSVLTTTISDAQLIVKQMPNTVYLTKMKWTYPLKSPFIDGFALIYRLQTYWWCWAVKKTISGSTPLSLTEIMYSENDYIDYTTLGGDAGLKSMIDEMLMWITENQEAFNTQGANVIYPHPYMYMSFTDNELYEILKVSLKPQSDPEPLLTTWRNVEQVPIIWFEYVRTEAQLNYTAVNIYPTTNMSASSSVYLPGDIFVVMRSGQEYWDSDIYTITSVGIDEYNQYLIYFTPAISVNAPWPINSILIIGDTGSINFVPDWKKDSVLSYVPCENNDTMTLISDTSLRSVVFGNTVEIKCAIHLTLVAFKIIEEPARDDTPGYQRTNYIVWEVREDS